MAHNSLLLTHELLCLALLYSVFCRALKLCEKVRVDVRFAFFVLGLVACAGMAAPLAWNFVPDFFTLALLVAVTGVQLVTAYHWESGVPDRFYKPDHMPRQRRAGDILGECAHGKH